ncbi:MAG: signal recognition particle receptor subunit alpha, partial [Armatimonadetes bacterium]|nr:signal recognition particle receptor subunit alpha [Armatimonadota bacterium]
MFEALTDKLNQIFRRLRSRGKLLEADVAEALREVRIALLEADVSLKAVKDFVARVKEKAIGKEVLESLTPGQAVIKIVHDELVELLGPSHTKLAAAPSPPSIYLLVGLQGSGKTTTTGKLAFHLKEQGKNPLLVASDVQRPAAIKQLQVLGDQLGIPVFSMGEKVTPLQICKGALQHALSNGRDCVLIDTAGRLHIADDLMQELAEIKENIKPHDTLLVV